MKPPFAEEIFGRTAGADAYIDLILEYPELLDQRVISIARQSARVALLNSSGPETGGLIPELVAKAIVREIDDLTLATGRYGGQNNEAG